MAKSQTLEEMLGRLGSAIGDNEAAAGSCKEQAAVTPMTDERVTGKTHAERTYRYRVDVEEQPSGFGSRLSAMLGWCQQRGMDWASYGHQITRPGDGPQDVTRFYFMGKRDALVFQARWGGGRATRGK
ncbi:MAG: hypothetical protein GEU92_12530 [Alphaproteobacteria bacterium]|nr:hypothetical protein [Alphaproteobacteria bacterium]